MLEEQKNFLAQILTEVAHNSVIFGTHKFDNITRFGLLGFIDSSLGLTIKRRFKSCLRASNLEYISNSSFVTHYIFSVPNKCFDNVHFELTWDVVNASELALLKIILNCDLFLVWKLPDQAGIPFFNCGFRATFFFEDRPEARLQHSVIAVGFQHSKAIAFISPEKTGNLVTLLNIPADILTCDLMTFLGAIENDVQSIREKSELY